MLNNSLAASLDTHCVMEVSSHALELHRLGSLEYVPAERRTIRFGWLGERVDLTADEAETHLARLGLTLDDLGLSRSGDALRVRNDA